MAEGTNRQPTSEKCAKCGADVHPENRGFHVCRELVPSKTNPFEADLSRLDHVRVRLKDARKYGLAVRLDDAVFLVEFIDKLWKEYTRTLTGNETEADGPTCLWEPIEEGIRCYNTCRPGEEFNLDDGCDPYPFCHWCGRRIVIPECPWCGGEHVGTDCRAEKANTQKAVDQRAIDANALADAHRMYEAEHGHPFSESEGER